MRMMLNRGGTVTKTMQIFLVTCFLMITFLSQGMDGKNYLIKTGDEDDVEPYITETLIKFDPNEDVDGIEILMKNLKGHNLKNFLKMTKKQKEDVAAVIEEKIAELKGTGVDYASFYCSGQFSCGGANVNEYHNINIQQWG